MFFSPSTPAAALSFHPASSTWRFSTAFWSSKWRASALLAVLFQTSTSICNSFTERSNSPLNSCSAYLTFAAMSLESSNSARKPEMEFSSSSLTMLPSLAAISAISFHFSSSPSRLWTVVLRCRFFAWLSSTFAFHPNNSTCISFNEISRFLFTGIASSARDRAFWRFWHCVCRSSIWVSCLSNFKFCCSLIILPSSAATSALSFQLSSSSSRLWMAVRSCAFLACSSSICAFHPRDSTCTFFNDISSSLLTVIPSSARDKAFWRFWQRVCRSSIRVSCSVDLTICCSITVLLSWAAVSALSFHPASLSSRFLMASWSSLLLFCSSCTFPFQTSNSASSFFKDMSISLVTGITVTAFWRFWHCVSRSSIRASCSVNLTICCSVIALTSSAANSALSFHPSRSPSRTWTAALNCAVFAFSPSTFRFRSSDSTCISFDELSTWFFTWTPSSTRDRAFWRFWHCVCRSSIWVSCSLLLIISCSIITFPSWVTNSTLSFHRWSSPCAFSTAAMSSRFLACSSSTFLFHLSNSTCISFDGILESLFTGTRSSAKDKAIWRFWHCVCRSRICVSCSLILATWCCKSESWLFRASCLSHVRTGDSLKTFCSGMACCWWQSTSGSSRLFINDFAWVSSIPSSCNRASLEAKHDSASWTTLRSLTISSALHAMDTLLTTLPVVFSPSSRGDTVNPASRSSASSWSSFSLAAAYWFNNAILAVVSSQISSKANRAFLQSATAVPIAAFASVNSCSNPSWWICSWSRAWRSMSTCVWRFLASSTLDSRRSRRQSISFTIWAFSASHSLLLPLNWERSLVKASSSDSNCSFLHLAIPFSSLWPSSTFSRCSSLFL